ncbi:MAG TPA: cation-transporting P-type ATPase, partial [Pelolinea sp.]|nr:cation-transporting P-type ATPase [Pelolinea sp.]
MESQKNVGAYWGKKTNSVISELGSRKIGLTTNEASERLLHYGHNALTLKKKTSPFEMFINQFKSPIILILIFASLISAIVQEWSDSIIILLIIVGSSFLSFFQEFNAGNAAEKLKSQISIKSAVLRNKI